MHTVTFEPVGGTFANNTTDAKKVEVENGEKVTAEVVRKDDNTFEGWFTDSTFTTEYDFDTAVTKDITLYAKWEAIPVTMHTVTFEPVGGTFANNTTDAKKVEVENGEKVTAEVVRKDDNTFEGWYTDSTYTAKYDFDTAVTEDITLYAKWEADTTQPVTKYTVTYYGNENTGGKAPVDSKLYNSGDTVKVEGKNTLHRTNYTFKGWSTSKYATKVECTEGNKFTIVKDTSLYAVWEKDSNNSEGGWTWRGSSTSTTESKKASEGILTHMAYLNGYTDNTIRPQGSITRAEVGAIFARLKVGEANIPTSTIKYGDVNSSDWYTKYIAFVTDNKIMEGYEDGSFRPNDNITRAEFIAVVAKYNSLTDKVSKFEDVSEHWAAGCIGSVTDKGWINGYPDGTFKPEKSISREEVVTITNKMLGKKVDKSGLNNLLIEKFTDLDENSWSYFDIIEAAYSHESVIDKDTNLEVWKELIK